MLLSPSRVFIRRRCWGDSSGACFSRAVGINQLSSQVSFHHSTSTHRALQVRMENRPAPMGPPSTLHFNLVAETPKGAFPVIPTPVEVGCTQELRSSCDISLRAMPPSRRSSNFQLLRSRRTLMSRVCWCDGFAFKSSFNP